MVPRFIFNLEVNTTTLYLLDYPNIQVDLFNMLSYADLKMDLV